MAIYLRDELAAYQKTEADVARLEVFLNENCGLPEAFDFTNRDHLLALVHALATLSAWCPLLVSILRNASDLRCEHCQDTEDDCTQRVSDRDERIEKIGKAGAKLHAALVAIGCSESLNALNAHARDNWHECSKCRGFGYLDDGDECAACEGSGE